MSELRPKHIGFIMDGNRTWARRKGLPTIEGHREGTKRIEPVASYGIEKGIEAMTFWAFSSENWQRAPEEVGDLMSVFREALGNSPLIEKLLTQGSRIDFMGEIHIFPHDIVCQIEQLKERSSANETLALTVALGYGGRQELIKACNLAITDGVAKLDESTFTKYLDNQRDVDFIVRTGGQSRLSGFMPWQSIYAELQFSDTLWPDYTVEKFQESLDIYAQRNRKFGM